MDAKFERALKSLNFTDDCMAHPIVKQYLGWLFYILIGLYQNLIKPWKGILHNLYATRKHLLSGETLRHSPYTASFQAFLGQCISVMYRRRIGDERPGDGLKNFLGPRDLYSTFIQKFIVLQRGYHHARRLNKMNKIKSNDVKKKKVYKR